MVNRVETGIRTAVVALGMLTAGYSVYEAGYQKGIATSADILAQSESDPTLASLYRDLSLRSSNHSQENTRIALGLGVITTAAAVSLSINRLSRS